MDGGQEDRLDHVRTEKMLMMGDKTCRSCVYRERWECGSKIISYCGLRTSRRTHNGKLKIKATSDACRLYKFNENRTKH